MATSIKEPMDETVLDTTGLACPLPILKARKALAGLQRGHILQIIATDPQSLADFQTFCQQLGHDLLAAREERGQFHILLRKG